MGYARITTTSETRPPSATVYKRSATPPTPLLRLATWLTF
jgi:hypothetical protein